MEWISKISTLFQSGHQIKAWVTSTMSSVDREVLTAIEYAVMIMITTNVSTRLSLPLQKFHTLFQMLFHISK